MVNDDEVEFLREHVHRRVAEFVERAFLPLDAHARMGFLVALRGGDERRKRAAVVPRDSGKMDGRTHAGGVGTAARRPGDFSETFPILARTGRIFSCRPVCADSHAASMISLAVRPSSPGEPLPARPRMPCIQLTARDRARAT